MDEKDLGELRELVEFLKNNGIAQFEMERADLKVKLKFAGAAEPVAAAGSVDLGQLAQMLGQGTGTTLATPAVTGSAPGESVLPGAVVAAAEALPAASQPELHMVKSPLVGTFYAASSPGAEPFVKVGDHVAAGQVLCIVEAMKLMNEVEADAAGEVVRVLVQSGQPIEFGQPLFAVRA